MIGGSKIYSARKQPWELTAHERMLIRLPVTHEKYLFIQEKAYQIRAGYSGEVEIDRILPEIGLPEEHVIMKDIRLEVFPNFYIQIDTLILTNHRIFLLEIKKYAGTICFDEKNGKTIKTSRNQVIEKFDCVVHQVDRAVFGLQQILHKLSDDIQIHPIIVMANSNVDIVQYPQFTPVKFKKQIPKYIREILKNKENHKLLSLPDIVEHLKQYIAEKPTLPLCERYGINKQDLKKGVLCLQCHEPMGMTQGRTWTCHQGCENQASALTQAISDWFYLFNTSITNRQLRTYLGIQSKSATRILKMDSLQKIGRTKNTYYLYSK